MGNTNQVDLVAVRKYRLVLCIFGNVGKMKFLNQNNTDWRVKNFPTPEELKERSAKALHYRCPVCNASEGNECQVGARCGSHQFQRGRHVAKRAYSHSKRMALIPR